MNTDDTRKNINQYLSNSAIESLKEGFEKALPVVEHMDLKAIEIQQRYCKLRAPLKGNENHIESLHAGVMFTLAEAPGGILFYTNFDTSKYYPVVKEMNICYLRPALTDVTIEMSISDDEINRIQTEASSKGKADYVLEGELKDNEGMVVAKTRGVYQMRRKVIHKT